MSNSEADNSSATSGSPIPSALATPSRELTKALPTAPGKALKSVEPMPLGAEVASSDWLGSAWFWVGVVSLILVAGAAVFFWRKRKGKTTGPWSMGGKAVAEYDPQGDYSLFRSRLPAEVVRALDDYHPIIVLGNNASEKERLVLRLSGVESNQQRLRGRAIFAGMSLAIYLGARTLVLVPTEQFLGSPDAHQNPSWEKLLRCVCRIRSPRVLICLSQAPIDAGALEEITAWASRLRAHVERLSLIRNAAIETNVVFAQAPEGGTIATIGLTDAFFRLLRSLGVREGFGEIQRVSLEGFNQGLPADPEEATRAAKDYVAGGLRRLERAWPTLLIHEECAMPELLRHVRLFEEFEGFTTRLGASLAEVFSMAQGRPPHAVAVDLWLLPDHEAAWGNALGLFAPSTHVDGKWRPSAVVAHRVYVATGTLVLAVLMSIGFAASKREWEFVAKQALEYVPPVTQGKLSAVREYSLQLPQVLDQRLSGDEDWFSRVTRKLKWAAHGVYLKLTFFNRDLPRCVVVDATRDYLESNLVNAIRRNEPPEYVLPLAALFLTGDPWDCDTIETDRYAAQSRLKELIGTHAEQWGLLTGLPAQEVEEYLSLACPYKAEPTTILNQLVPYGGKQRIASHVASPDGKGFVSALQELRGGCALEPKERDALALARQFAEPFELAQKTVAYGVAFETLHKLKALGTTAATTLHDKFEPYESRFRELDELAFEHEDLELLVRDLRAVPATSKVQAGDSLATIHRLLVSQSREFPSPDVVEVRMSFFGESYVIDRRKVRTSALLESLERFGRRASEVGNGSGIPEALFFRPEDYGRIYSWLPATAIPNGIFLENSVLWRYTGEGFDAAIRKPLERLTELADRVTCRGEDGQQVKGEIFDGIRRFATTYVSAYLAAYESQWRRLYDGFRVSPTDDKHLADVLLAFTRPSSPQLAMLREVQRQTALTIDDTAPWAKNLAAVKETFEGLSGGLDDKAFGEYQGLLLELANAAAEAKGEGAAPGKSKSPKGDPVEAFLQELTGLARLVALGVREPKNDVLSRGEAWLAAAKIPSDLRRPFVQPIESAYGSGRTMLAKAFQGYWERERAKLDADWLALYPFAPKAESDASVLAVRTWLHPSEGRFFVEVAPICDWMIDNSKALGVSVPATMPETVARLRALSQTLFDSKGEPSPVRVKWEPVPFAAPTIKGMSLILGDVYERYYNDVPRTTVLSVPWATEYVASIKVELVGATSEGETTLVVPSRKSPWAFYHLLDAAQVGDKVEKTPSGTGRSQLTERTWILETTNERGNLRAWGSIHYRVCAPALGDERAREVLRCN